MKRSRKLFVLLIAVCMLANILSISALAFDDQTAAQSVVYYADGSYLVTRITYDSVDTSRAVKEKSGTKHYDYYDSSRKLAWTFQVHGTFTYDGHSAKATFADYSYNIYDSAWSFDSADASYTGATATATGSFTLFVSPNSVTVSLTCSPKGVLS